MWHHEVMKKIGLVFGLILTLASCGGVEPVAPSTDSGKVSEGMIVDRKDLGQCVTKRKSGNSEIMEKVHVTPGRHKGGVNQLAPMECESCTCSNGTCLCTGCKIK